MSEDRRFSVPEYEETQRWPDWSVWLVTIGAGGFILFMLVMAWRAAAPCWQGGTPNWPIVAICLVAAAAETFVIYMFAAGKLTIQVYHDGIFVRLHPFPGRLIPFEQVEEIASAHFSPLRDFGGWGVRWRGRTTAYIIRGNRGITVKLRNGRTVVIASQDPDALTAIAQRAFQRWKRLEGSDSPGH